MIYVLMGVSGSGKTTVGRRLADRLGCGFSDADDYHSPANVEKMRAGIPLTDADRLPWLQDLNQAITAWRARGESRVLACSALKQAYRDRLSPDGRATFVYLRGSAELIGTRLRGRQGHYMNPDLLQSQFAALEVPRDALIVDITGEPDAIVDDILAALQPTALCSAGRA